MGEKNDRILKGVQIVPERRLQGNDITFTLPPGPQTLTVLKIKNVRFLIPCLRNLTQNPTPLKIFARKGYPAKKLSDEIDTLFKTKIPDNQTLMARTSTFSR